MLKIDRAGKTLATVEELKLSDVNLSERYDLQKMILSSPDVFFAEMREELLIIGEEVEPTDVVGDRIDLLALDSEGAAVIIELKRGSHKLHLLQAIAYAGMVAKWDADRFSGELARTLRQTTEDARESIADFIQGDVAQVNTRQRIVLLAEDFDFEVLVAAEWLSDHYDVDIRCYRLALAHHAGEDFLSCTCIFPPPEITDFVRRPQTQKTVRPSAAGWGSWDEVLAQVTNPHEQEFFRAQLAAGVAANLKAALLTYHNPAGEKLFLVTANRKRAYVWQRGRFEGDIAFWRQKLGEAIQIKEVWKGQRVHFFLNTADEFAAFTRVLQDLDGISFEPSPGAPEERAEDEA